MTRDLADPAARVRLAREVLSELAAMGVRAEAA
jgi:hypothetical protein